MYGHLALQLRRFVVVATMLAISGCRAVVTSEPSTPTQTVRVSPAPPTSSASESAPTSTKAPAATWTPIPTLSPTEAVSQTIQLFRNNAGCELPCWWGLIPGETSWETARQFLAAFASHIGSGESSTDTQNGVSYYLENFDVQYPVAGHRNKGLTNYDVVNGVVNLIWVLPRGTEVRYPIHQLLATQGKPEKVWMAVDPDSNLFHFLLYYPKRGTTALYEGQANRGDDSNYQLCLQESGPELWLWSPGKVFLLNDDRFIGPDFGLGPNGHERYMRPIETVELDLETFYRAFGSAGPACIDTPRSLWEVP